MAEEKKIYFLHSREWDEEIPFKLSKKEKDLIEWFLNTADIDYMYFKDFTPESCHEFNG